ncbi:rhomboid family intramembrane serine protease [Saccharobesus litoralis]|uniref:Rhomboid family intramembrane serine protease n=1 Tax=Saccharobesus litoralis TaxID=2172099 RepID=A0A2S0VUN4_9ALTE|nr:rhomboid family intramembrane serine protease [Saccharobesus litoralis]AWB67937.1 rhomboid family intramembrane serine protease [Saccharobesus litoralis]
MKKLLSDRFDLLFKFIGLVIAVEILNLLTGRILNHLGIYPRDLFGLVGIITAPFLHASIWHFLSNIVPLTILGLILSVHGPRKLAKASLIIMALGGGLVWLFARSSFHIGASGLVFGWWAFLLALGYYQRDWKAIGTAIAVLLLYSGMFVSLFSLRSPISFESHLFGAFAGIVAAAYLGKAKQQS